MPNTNSTKNTNCCPCKSTSNLNKNTPPTQLEVLTNPTKISPFITKYKSSPPNTKLEAYDNLKFFNSFEQMLEYNKNKK